MPSWTLRRKSRRVECQRVQGAAGVETVVPTQREGERELSVRRRRWLDGMTKSSTRGRRRNGARVGRARREGVRMVQRVQRVRMVRMVRMFGWRILETGWRGDSIYHGRVPIVPMRSTRA